MHEDITYVGMDAHKKSIAVAMLRPGGQGALEWEINNTPSEIKKLARKLKRHAPGEIRCCYETGPTGYGLQRMLESEGMICEVVAPSLIPMKPGERIKTDRRDALKLAELLRAGLLTGVQPPTPEEESLRDLCRCREDAKEDQTRARHRLGKFLLRNAIARGRASSANLDERARRAVARSIVVLSTMIPRARAVVRQTRARVLRGITNSADKLISIFEPYAQILGRGKPHPPTEFGLLVRVKRSRAKGSTGIFRSIHWAAIANNLYAIARRGPP